jgi:hypothetical protein
MTYFFTINRWLESAHSDQVIIGLIKCNNLTANIWRKVGGQLYGRGYYYRYLLTLCQEL